MAQVISVLIIAGFTLLIGRLGTIALTATGLPRPIAKFQARSALSGAGYTTNESESIVSHPARRKIVMTLMTVGSLGAAGLIAALIGSFLGVSGWGAGLRRGCSWPSASSGCGWCCGSPRWTGCCPSCSPASSSA